MENNAATRFFGRGLGWSFTQTVANIPPAKRAAFYAVLDTAFPLVTDVAIARLPIFRRPADQISTVNKGPVLARVMKNLDKLAALVAKGGAHGEGIREDLLPGGQGKDAPSTASRRRP